MIDLVMEAETEFWLNEKVWDIDLPSTRMFVGKSEKMSGINTNTMKEMMALPKIEEKQYSKKVEGHDTGICYPF